MLKAAFPRLDDEESVTVWESSQFPLPETRIWAPNSCADLKDFMPSSVHFASAGVSLPKKGTSSSPQKHTN